MIFSIQLIIPMNVVKAMAVILVLTSAFQARHLQTVYDAIIIGSGAAGIGAAVTLASKNLNFIILEARNRTGGRTYATTVSGVDVDLGASFVHSPESNNAIDTYVKQLNWGKTLSNFSASEGLQQGSYLNQTEESQAKTIIKGFATNAQNQVNNGVDIDLQTAWNTYKATLSNYSENVIYRAYFELLLQAVLNGADLNTLSTINYVTKSASSTYDYLPATSYQALINAIYKAYCKNAQIILNQVVKSIDYSGSVVKISTATQAYYANKVINTVPLGCLQNNDVTFIPELPDAYKTAINSIGNNVFNKIIVTLNDSFWVDTTNTRVVNLVFPTNQTHYFPQFYVAPTNPKLLLFFVSGNNSITLSQSNDAAIIGLLQTTIQKYTTKSLNVTNYTITRWQKETFSRGSYSYFKVGTKTSHFTTLMTPINNKLWFAGEHVHPNQSSNVHGAFQSGMWAGALSGIWQIVGLLSLILLLA